MLHYYVLQTGAYSSSVTAADVKLGTNSVGTNKGSLPFSGDILLRGLSASTNYTLYAVADADGDGLIEIATLEQLNNMRFSLAGTSYKAYAGDTGLTTGCGSNAAATVAAGGEANKCHGYELTANLDFRAGCGAEGTAASACTYSDRVPRDNSGNVATPADGTNTGWAPIGDYSLINPNWSPLLASTIVYSVYWVFARRLLKSQIVRSAEAFVCRFDVILRHRRVVRARLEQKEQKSSSRKKRESNREKYHYFLF